MRGAGPTARRWGSGWGRSGGLAPPPPLLPPGTRPSRPIPQLAIGHTRCRPFRNCPPSRLAEPSTPSRRLATRGNTPTHTSPARPSRQPRRSRPRRLEANQPTSPGSQTPPLPGLYLCRSTLLQSMLVKKRLYLMYVLHGELKICAQTLTSNLDRMRQSKMRV